MKHFTKLKKLNGNFSFTKLIILPINSLILSPFCFVIISYHIIFISISRNI